MTLKDKICSLLHHPSIIKDIFLSRDREKIREMIKSLNRQQLDDQREKEIHKFIADLKQRSPDTLQGTDELGTNRLCNIDDWENTKFKKIVNELQTSSLKSYNQRKDWIIPPGRAAVIPRKHDSIDRKDWEWALSG